MNKWKAYLPEFSLNVQFGPSNSRVSMNLHCSVRQRIANVSLEFLPTFDDLYSAASDASESYGAFTSSHQGRTFGVN